MLPSDTPKPNLSPKEAIQPPPSPPTPTSPAPTPQEEPPDAWELFRGAIYRRFGVPGLIVVAVVVLVWSNWSTVKDFPGIATIRTWFFQASLPTADPQRFSSPNVAATDHSIAAGGAITATAQPGGTAIITTGNVSVDANAIAESLVKAQERELAGFREREQAYQDREQARQDQIKALTKTVMALAEQQRQPNASPAIEDALTQLRQGHTAAAEAIFETILARKAAEGQAANQQAAEAARHLGALAFLHDTEKALNAYHQAVSLDPENTMGWTQLGHLLMRKGELDKAADAYRKVLTLGEKANDRDSLASAYGNLGNVYLAQDNLDHAEAMTFEVLRTLGDTASNRGLLASSYGNLSLICLTRGNLGEAETRLREALKLNKALGNKQGMARQYINLGNVYLDRGDRDRAEAEYRNALALNEGYKEVTAAAYRNLGSVYLGRGDRDQAEAICDKALKLYEAVGMKTGIAAAYGCLSNVYLARGIRDQAEAMYRNALELYEAVGSKEGSADQYVNLGGVYLAQRDLDRAEAMYRNALKLHEAVGSKKGIADAYGCLGNVYLARGIRDQAEAEYRKALPLLQEVGAAPQIEQIQKVLRALAAQGS
jgi:protein O-GlcNAc transferase